jgi:A/G-specific adenine glycosylase
MNYSDIHDRIGSWYHHHGRHDLPWRKTNDPYIIYISEMMLQQTQVKRVLECFFFPFIGRFPTLQSVKEATLDDVMHAWQGLGYYRRARYIHETAKIAAPSLPTNPNRLIKLPGIGKSTAHAIAAFSVKAPLPVLDANVKRILRRFFALENATDAHLWEKAYLLLDRNDPYGYNQAMMDIGATLCLPKSADCNKCPLAGGCHGKEDPLAYTAIKKEKKRAVKTTHYLLLRRNRKILMCKRSGPLLGGLWELPSLDHEPAGCKKLFEIMHDYTHFRRIALIYRCDRTDISLKDIEGEWIDMDNLDSIATSSLEKKIFSTLSESDSD